MDKQRKPRKTKENKGKPRKTKETEENKEIGRA